MNYDNLNANDKIIRAKINLQKTNPFFAYLVMSLKQRELNEIETAGVDTYGNFAYNKKFIEDMNEEEVKVVCLHEILHMVFQHLLRRKVREPQLWNIACDLKVNTMIDDNYNNAVSACQTLSRDGVTLETIKKIGFKIDKVNEKTAEEIYDIMESQIPKQNQQKQGKGNKGQGRGQGQNSQGQQGNSQSDFVKGYKGFDKHFFFDDMTEKEKKELERKSGKSIEEIAKDIEKDLKDKLTEAYEQAKMRGNLPNGMERMFDKMIQSKLDWRSLLYKYVTREIPYDYTYSRPSKKSTVTGIFMPSTLKEMLEVVVGIDVSGSVDQKLLSEFMSEVITIAKSFANVKITVLTHDVSVHDELEVKNGNISKLLEMKVHGGGGTSHKPIFKHIADNYPRTKLAVFLTDGFSEFPENETVKSLWVLSKDSCKEDDIPFGTVIKME
jgi:predicted metal-dependent peptidase